MNRIQQIKIMLKSFFISIKSIVLMYIMLPMLLVLIFSFVNNKVGNVVTEIPVVYVSVIDEDNSALSAELVQLLTEEPFETDDKDAYYTITIPEGYEADILSLTPVEIAVEESKSASGLAETILFSVLNAYDKSLTETMLIYGEEQIVDKNTFLMQLQELNTASPVVTEILEPEERNLTGYENAVISVVGYVFFMLLYNLGESHYRTDGTGTRQRIHSLPVTQVQLLNHDVMEGMLLGIVVFTLSYAAFGIFGAAFRQNFLYFIPVILIESVMASVLGSFVHKFLPKSIGYTVLMIIMMVDLISNAMPIKILELMSAYNPGKILHVLCEYALAGNMSGILQYIGYAGIVTVAAYFIIVVKIKRKWRNQ